MQLGFTSATPVLIGDTAKGTIAGLVGLVVADGRWWGPVVGTGAAMVGHAWPVFAHGRGGRSVLTFVGGAVVISPLSALIAGGLAAAVWETTRRFEWAARVGVFAFPIIQLAVDGVERAAATGVLMTLIGARFAMARRSDRRALS